MRKLGKGESFVDTCEDDDDNEDDDNHYDDNNNNDRSCKPIPVNYNLPCNNVIWDCILVGL